MTDELTDTLKSIRLTREGKTPQEKSIRILKGTKSDIIAEPARGIILRVLRHGIEDTITEERFDDDGVTKVIIQKKVTRNILSVSDIVNVSKEFEEGKNPLTKSQVYHHLPKLMEYDYVIHYGTVRKGKRDTDYYRRTAELFIFESFPGDSKKEMRKKIVEVVKNTIKIFGLDIDDLEKDELIELGVKIWEIEHESYQKIIPHAEGDIADPEFEYLFRDALVTHTSGSDEWLKARRRMREILFRE
ncbi:MAG: hypothetical protein ACW98Y_13910 [Candidatus Thorarchaeota archaeon]|jgi:DNA-binding transcriptional ArsR family regulator